MIATRAGTLALALVLLASALPSSRPAAAADALEPEQALARDIYAELVGIDTTAEHGSTTVAAEAVAARLRAAGIPEDQVHVVEPAPGKGNLVARLHGSGEAPPLLLLAHLDVVEARPEDWSVPPFALLERDGFFWGRGSLDDKAMAAIFTARFLRFAREDTPLRRDVILALTADEEGGPHNGVEWLLEHRREWVDAGLVLNEGGGARMRDGRKLVNQVQALEKTYMSYALEVTDPGGHSSLPRPGNAIAVLARGLARLDAYPFPVELNDVTRSWLERSARSEGKPMARAMRALAADPANAEAAAVVSSVPAYAAVLRTTCTPTRLEAGHADNALPQTARALVNCRILPGHDAEEVRGELLRVLEEPRIEVRAIEEDTSAPAQRLDPELLATIERVSEEIFPGVPVVPTMSAGATDSRYFRRAGIPAYGIMGLFVDVDDVRAHGRDERLPVQSFWDGQRFLDRLVEALAVAGPSGPQT